LYQEKKSIEKKYRDGQEKCKKKPEELEKCMKDVEAEHKASLDALNAKIWKLVPQVFTTLLAMLKCLF